MLVIVLREVTIINYIWLVQHNCVLQLPQHALNDPYKVKGKSHLRTPG